MTDRGMSLAMGLSYYHPYVSGLTETARLVAEGLVERGWSVSVVATQHDPGLTQREVVGGVVVHRLPVVARLGKGVIAPRIIPVMVREGERHGLLNLHSPLLEAGPVARRARVPVITTYHCDVTLPAGLLNRAQMHAMDWSSRAALRASTVVVPSSMDYLDSSRVRAAARQDAVHVIHPPCLPRPGGKPSFRRTGGFHVGFLGRLVEEKGVEYLVDAFRRMPDPDARLLIAGDYTNVAGGSVVDRVRQHIASDPRIELLGFVPDGLIPDFYASLDVFALPSVNALEAFGIVQVEAMMAGVPVIASGLPGVREPLRRTGFGRVVAPRDVAALERAMRELKSSPPDRERGSRLAREQFGLSRTLDAYEAVLEEARRRRR